MGVLWPLLFALVAGMAAILGSGLILLFGKRADVVADWLLPFAVEALLGVATLGLLPEALEYVPAERAFGFFLAGLVAFIAFERVVRWRHHHTHGEEEAPHERVRRSALAAGGFLYIALADLVPALHHRHGAALVVRQLVLVLLGVLLVGWLGGLGEH